MECMWCNKNANLEAVTFPVKDMSSGTLYLHRDQTHPGRCIFAYKDHVRRLSELDDEEYLMLMKDIRSVMQALDRVFSPDKINLLVLGDISTHMHIHICPKYKGKVQWGIPFNVNEEHPMNESDEELELKAIKIMEEL